MSNGIEIKVPIEELRKRKLFLATPMYGGVCAGMFARSVMDLASLCTHYGIPLQTYYLFNESLITRARNYCCIPHSSNIRTEDGVKTMKWIVENKYSGKVLTFNEKTGKKEWNRILNHWSQTNDLGKKWVSIGANGRSKAKLICTDDHPVAVIDDIFLPKISYVQAKDTINKFIVKNDNNLTSNRSKINKDYNNDQIKLLLGTVMGDSFINKNGSVIMTHGYKQREYLEYKKNCLNIENDLKERNSGFVDRKSELLEDTVLAYTVNCDVTSQTKVLRNMFYENGVKHVGNILSYLDEISLAFWYMDDGHLVNNRQATLCTQGFTYDDHLKMQKWFKNTYDIDVIIKKSHQKILNYLHFDNINTDKFFNLISPYVHKSMKYKLTDEYKIVKNEEINNIRLDYSTQYITNVQYLSKDDSRVGKLYDIEVENNHNFYANETLVHNCDEFIRSDCTHMMFVDSDIGFNANDVIALLALASDDSPYDIISGPYPKKCISWEKVKVAVDKGFADKNPNDLEKYVGDYVFNPKGGTQSIPIGQPVEVLESGTGFMMIRKNTFKKFAEAFPEYSYKPDHVRTEAFDGTREIMMYFQAEIDPVSKRYLSEDYFFCLPSRAKIETEDGLMTIKKIVDTKYNGKVKSLENNQFVWKNITNHWVRSNKDQNKKWVKIKTNSSNNKRFDLVCTDDHEIAVTDSIFDIKVEFKSAKLTEGKYSVRKADKVNNPLFNKEQQEAIIGTVLGDGYISKNGQINIIHSIKQKEYIEFKQNLFGGKLLPERDNSGFGDKHKCVSLYVPVNQQTKDLSELMYEDGKKTIKNVIDMITPVSLALWYMDDGSLNKNNNELRLSTASFSEEDNQMIINMLSEKYGINMKMRKHKLVYRDEEREYIYLTTDAKNRDKFLSVVTPYMIQSMGYKTTDNYSNIIGSHNYDNKFLDISCSKIKEIKYLKNYHSKLYDIEVEDTHNFVANQTVVHNCQKIQEIGLKNWLCPWMKLQHVGTYVFGGSLADLAAVGASATADVGLLKKVK